VLILPAHGKDFKDFVLLLSFEESLHISERGSDLTHNDVATYLLSLPEAQKWLTSTDGENKILRLVIGNKLEEERLFDSLTTTVGASKKLYHPTILRVGKHYQSGPKTESGIVASLIKQTLHQQPQLYPVVESLFPLVYDATLSRSTRWKKRVLWRCLETLLLSPRDDDTFLFVTLGEPDLHGIFSRILWKTAETETRVRTAITISSLDFYPRSLPLSAHFDVDVLSNVFHTTPHHDITIAQDIATHQSSVSSATRTAISVRLSDTALITASEVVRGVLGHSASRPTLLSSISPLRNANDHSEGLKLFTHALQSDGVWPFFTILWATRAVRPLSVSELNILLTLEGGSNHDNRRNESALEEDCASLLLQLLPGMFFVVNGTLKAGRVRAWEHEAKMIFEKRLGRTVDAHLAEVCLLYLLDICGRGRYLGLS
jgi:hypothetical protein